MTSLVLENLALLSTAPGGASALRELILELAMRGALTTRDADDLSDPMPSAPSTALGPPNSLPSSWAWVRLDQVAQKITDGTHHSPPNGRQGDFKYISAKNIKPWGMDLTDVTFVTTDVHEQIFARCDPALGDVLYIKDGATTGIVTINTLAEPFSMLSSVALIKPGNSVYNRFLVLAMQAPAFYRAMREGMTGVAITRVTLSKLKAANLPLPPLAEQHRIVAKVDELMALCNRLEARQQDAEAAHARLVQALLDSLTQARDAEEFQACWQLVAEQFQALLTTDASVERLEAVVLQLAVTGRLTSQGKSIEAPADDAPDLPPLATGWAYRAFNELIDPERPIAYGVLVPGPEVEGGVPFARIADLSLQAPAEQPERSISPEVDAKFSRTRLIGGEILMGVVGSVGKLGIAPASWAGANIARAICRIAPAKGVNKDYLVLLLRSDLMRRQFLGDTRTLAQPTLNVGLIRAAKAPLPPLAEQAKAVQTAHDILALCDQLKARITAARAKHAQLAEALVAQAVAA